jgi:hypothetical protein
MFAIFEKLGGTDAAIAVLSRRLNWTPSKDTIKKWRANRQIGARATIALIDECRERGIECDPIDDFRGPPRHLAEAAE